MADKALFSRVLIDKSVQNAVPEDYEIRPLARNDYSKGFFNCLDSLTSTGNVTEARFHEQFDWMVSKDGWFYNVVIEDKTKEKIVGTGVLICERKLWDLIHQPSQNLPLIKP